MKESCEDVVAAFDVVPEMIGPLSPCTSKKFIPVYVTERCRAQLW